jgi:hypothetical protein
MEVPMSAALDEEALLVKLRRDRMESEKFMAEREKLFREADKLQMDRLLAPFIALGGILIGLFGLAIGFLRH